MNSSVPSTQLDDPEDPVPLFIVVPVLVSGLDPVGRSDWFEPELAWTKIFLSYAHGNLLISHREHLGMARLQRVLASLQEEQDFFLADSVGIVEYL